MRVKMEEKGREEVSFLRLGGKKDVGREGRWWVSLTHQAHRFLLFPNWEEILVRKRKQLCSVFNCYGTH